MRPAFVIVLQELMRLLTYLIEGLEEGEIEHFIAKASVVTLDEGVLVGFTRLDVANLDAMSTAPVDELTSHELRSVVAANRHGGACARRLNS